MISSGWVTNGRRWPHIGIHGVSGWIEKACKKKTETKQKQKNPWTWLWRQWAWYKICMAPSFVSTFYLVSCNFVHARFISFFFLPIPVESSLPFLSHPLLSLPFLSFVISHPLLFLLPLFTTGLLCFFVFVFVFFFAYPFEWLFSYAYPFSSLWSDRSRSFFPFPYLLCSSLPYLLFSSSDFIVSFVLLPGAIWRDRSLPLCPAPSTVCVTRFLVPLIFRCVFASL